MRVLVVEDERRLAAAVRRGLQAEGFAVDLAHDGEDGLHLAREGAYDALVLDLMLPKISGYRICRQLRAEENWVPILILSAKDGEYDQADGLDLGADDYLTKPFSYVVLAARLRALLRRGAQARPAQLRAGDLTLDPGTRQVRRGETAIDLTPREFALLEYLMRQAGQVVSKSSLLEHVWDAYDSVDPNVVEVYAGYLRRKIDNPFGRRALQTVRGACYPSRRRRRITLAAGRRRAAGRWRAARQRRAARRRRGRRNGGGRRGSGPAGDDQTVTFSVPRWWRLWSPAGQGDHDHHGGPRGGPGGRCDAAARHTPGLPDPGGGQHRTAGWAGSGRADQREPAAAYLVPVVAGTLTVQVLGPGGRIVDASPGADRLVPLLPPAQAAEAAMTGRAVLLDGRPFASRT